MYIFEDFLKSYNFNYIFKSFYTKNESAIRLMCSKIFSYFKSISKVKIFTYLLKKGMRPTRKHGKLKIKR